MGPGLWNSQNRPTCGEEAAAGRRGHGIQARRLDTAPSGRALGRLEKSLSFCLTLQKCQNKLDRRWRPRKIPENRSGADCFEMAEQELDARRMNELIF